MFKTIYGSTAIAHWYNDAPRKPHDVDYISNGNEKSSRGVEYYWMDAFNYLLDKGEGEYLSPNMIYTIKMSHLSYDINWSKHMYDAMFLKEKGCVLDKTFYNLLINERKKIHKKHSPKLSVKNDEFFKENVKRRYDHDWLHEQFAFYERPLNERIRPDLTSPMCTLSLWEKLSEEDKIKCALEELYVLTYERFIFVDNPLPIKQAKFRMLKNMIVSTTSGWFNLFLKENFKTLLLTNPPHICLAYEQILSGERKSSS